MGFKPYYNWNTFNTLKNGLYNVKSWKVLNLIITGIPSIQQIHLHFSQLHNSFKPYYNWNTFNTLEFMIADRMFIDVLNLIITGIPSIPLI